MLLYWVGGGGGDINPSVKGQESGRRGRESSHVGGNLESRTEKQEYKK